MTFKNAVLNTDVEARTANGMKALRSSLRNTTDLFFKFGASRGKTITVEFEKAYQENREVALRIIQWGRDVRGGAGERGLYRQSLLFLEKNYKDDLLDTRLLKNVAEIGRWDDLLIFTDQAVKDKSYGLIRDALEANDGLCAKWMPRKGEVARDLRTWLGWSPKFYRKRLVELTKVVETQMCDREWNAIEFSHVPSVAMARYAKAFGRNAPDAFEAYKSALEKGDPSVKVNASAVYPYDVIKSLRAGDERLADAQWKALPNYMGDAKVIPLVDVSGSMMTPAGNGKMSVTCLDIALSLGLYCSDKNEGAFKDLFLTFSDTSKFVHLQGNLSAKLRQMSMSDWGMSTNLHSAFNEILRVALTQKVAPADMPETVLILSDMQFNSCIRHDNSAMEMIQRKFSEAGYKVPNIVFWNLNSHDSVPVRFDEKGTALVSGFSPSIMKAILESDMDNMTPEAIMLQAVSSDRYAI